MRVSNVFSHGTKFLERTRFSIFDIFCLFLARLAKREVAT
jgi:hypothetical protein